MLSESICSVRALARCLHINDAGGNGHQEAYLHLHILMYLSEIVIAGRFLSKLCTCDIWLVDSNIVKKLPVKVARLDFLGGIPPKFEH